MTGTGARGAPTSGSSPTAAAERVARHKYAEELLRARSVLAAATLVWIFVGGGLDLATHSIVGSGSLGFVLAVQVTQAVVLCAILAVLYRRKPVPARLAAGLVAAVFPTTSLALALAATHMGGVPSAYVSAVFVVIMVEAIAIPLPWQRGLPLAGATALLYPLAMLVATRFDPELAAQLSDRRTLVVFVTYVAVLLAGAGICVWGGHVMWSLRRSVFESRKLGRYRLLKRIGKGGMGEVWRAEDRALRRQVALKILSPEHGKQPSRVARFEREIQATAGVSHPNVVRIHDWGVTDDGVWYYAMDCLEGADLATVVRTVGKLPPALAVHLFEPAARGLAEVHRTAIVHRDVKPGNLFVISSAGEPLRLEILDFGIAQSPGDDAELTRAGDVLGTPGYTAPEVMAGVPASVGADIYSFGAALYFALTGQSPQDAKHTPASAIVDGIPGALDDALVRALDPEPTRRFTSAGEFADALARAGTAWLGGFRIDRAPDAASSTGTAETRSDGATPTAATDEPATAVEGRR